MARNGVQQWNDAYPNEAVVLADICHQSLWLYGSANNACVTIVRHGNQCFIKRLMVDSEQTGCGIASRMIDDVVSRGISSNTKEIRVLTNHTNQPMINLVRKKQFSQIGQLIMPDRPQFGNFIEFQKDVQSTKPSPN
nr:GNAT family N-acetyltransferase [Lentilactobacillus dabitei]